VLAAVVAAPPGVVPGFVPTPAGRDAVVTGPPAEVTPLFVDGPHATKAMAAAMLAATSERARPNLGRATGDIGRTGYEVITP